MKRRSVVVALAVALLLCLAAVADAKKRRGSSKRRESSAFKKAFSACQQNDDCRDVPHGFLDQCAFQCVSQACYDKVYGGRELEEGEVDFNRRAEFVTCFTTEQSAEKRAPANDNEGAGGD